VLCVVMAVIVEERSRLPRRKALPHVFEMEEFDVACRSQAS
jgi:hypothetical protein